MGADQHAAGEKGACLCQDFADALNWASPAGSSDGEPDGCTVYYDVFLECDGDPSIDGIEGILLKWEPIEDEFCEPGPVGSGTFTFFSDLPPVAIDEENLFLIEKHSGEACEGAITGVFPSLVCDPVATDASSWSRLKRLYE